MSGIVKFSLVDQIYTELRNEIITQKISMGERLNVNELQNKFQISSTPIREALNRLQKEGLIEYKNNVGAKVIDIEEKDIIEIQQVAMALDSTAIKYALKSADVNIMAQELSEIIKRFNKTDDKDEQLSCIWEFTDVFYKYADNSRLTEISYHIKGQQGILRYMYRKQKENPLGIKDHVNMYKAVIAGDVNGAVKALEENYEKGTEILLKFFYNK